MEERLQKILAKSGYASRRKAEAWILEGRVAIDGRVCTELGTKADPTKQKITVDGQPILNTEAKYCIALHKPTSYISTVSDPEGRRTVVSLVTDLPYRLYPIGRLDYDTSGLLLLTNDGDLTNQLLHPSHHVEKVYRVTVVGMPGNEELRRLETGIRLEDGMTSPAGVEVLRKHPRESVIDLNIHEGRNRQVRRMFDAIGYPVKRLKRIQFGPIELGSLRPGAWRQLAKAEWAALYQAIRLPVPPYPDQRSSENGVVKVTQPERTKSRLRRR